MALEKQTIINLLFTVVSIILSFANSLAFTNKWFEVRTRGIFIITLAVINVSLRFTQFCCVRRKLKNLGNIGFSIFLMAIMNDDEDEEEEVIQKLENVDRDMHRKHAQMTAAFYIALSTFSDCTFDMIQGVILFYGIEYDNDVEFYLIIGTWLGFGEEILDFVEDMVSMAMNDCSSVGLHIFCFLLYVSILCEQSMGIYIAIRGLDGHNSFQTLCLGVNISLIIILCVCPCFIYSGYKNIGLNIMCFLFSMVNSGLFTVKLFNLRSRALFIISMSILNLFARFIQLIYAVNDKNKRNLIFVGIPTISDPIFDILNSYILFYDIIYENNIYFFLLIVKYVGSFQQFISLLPAVMLKICKCCFNGYGIMIFAALSFIIALAAQSMAIYIAINGLLDENLTFSIINWCINGLILLCVCCTGVGCCYCISNGEITDDKDVVHDIEME